MIMNNFKVQVRINYTFGKPLAMEKSIHRGIPDSRSLFQSIQGFLQFTYMGLLPMSHKAFRLFNIDFLLNLAIEEGCLYIHLNTASSEIMVLLVVYLATGANV